MRELRVYKSLPEWTAQTLPGVFQRKHNTKEGTWARLTVHAGRLRFSLLTEGGDVRSTEVFDASSGPRLVEPGAWHKVEAIDDQLRCQLSFLCEPGRYYEKKYDLTAPHSEVLALLPLLQNVPGRSVLDLGCGRGRNSVFLAEQGFHLTAVDRSDVSITTLREIQAAEKLSVSAQVYDIESASLAEVVPSGQVDHVISTVVFQFLEASRVPAIIADMQKVTRAGGYHLIVAPVSTDAVRCPIEFPFTFGAGEVRDYYEGWNVLRYEETIGEFHRRDENGERYRALFATIVARKP